MKTLLASALLLFAFGMIGCSDEPDPGPRPAFGSKAGPAGTAGGSSGGGPVSGPKTPPAAPPTK